MTTRAKPRVPPSEEEDGGENEEEKGEKNGKGGGECDPGGMGPFSFVLFLSGLFGLVGVQTARNSILKVQPTRCLRGSMDEPFLSYLFSAFRDVEKRERSSRYSPRTGAFISMEWHGLGFWRSSPVSRICSTGETLLKLRNGEQRPRSYPWTGSSPFSYLDFGPLSQHRRTSRKDPYLQTTDAVTSWFPLNRPRWSVCEAIRVNCGSDPLLFHRWYEHDFSHSWPILHTSPAH